MFRAVSAKSILATAAIAALVAVAAPSGTARADDDDDWFDVKIMRDVLRGFGLRRGDEEGIDYRERSPLVVPPSRALPPPETEAVAERNPAWPNDPDVKRRKEAAEKRRTAKNAAQTIEDDSRPLGRSELDRGRAASRSSASSATNTSTGNRGTGILSPTELGFTGFSWGKVFGGKKQEEYEPFTGEPPRTSLTQPPGGYQTPAPSYPYGINSKTTASRKGLAHEDRVSGERR